MQSIEVGSTQTTISISTSTFKRVLQKKRDNQTYDDIFSNLLDIADISDLEDVDGIVFLDSVPIDGEMKKLKKPIMLLLHTESDGSVDLANDEFKILVSCNSLTEALKDAGEQFAENLAMFSEPNQSEQSRIFGEKLRNSVWM